MNGSFLGKYLEMAMANTVTVRLKITQRTKDLK